MLTNLSVEEEDSFARVRERLKQHDDSRGSLIPILQMIQGDLGYLPAEAIDLAADHLDIPVAEVYGVASFYNQFKFNPPGKYPVKVCLGTACHVRGGDIILENFERKLDIKEGQTTEDREFSLERVACVGCCALAPVVLMGEETHSYMTPSKVEGIFTQIRVKDEMAAKNQDKIDS